MVFDSGFDNEGHTGEEIETSKIVKYSAAIEQRNSLRIKAAKINLGDLAPLSENEQVRFTHYMNRIKDAGVHIDTIGNAEMSANFQYTVNFAENGFFVRHKV